MSKQCSLLNIKRNHNTSAINGVIIAPIRAFALQLPSPRDRTVVGYTYNCYNNLIHYLYEQCWMHTYHFVTCVLKKFKFRWKNAFINILSHIRLVPKTKKTHNVYTQFTHFSRVDINSVEYSSSCCSYSKNYNCETSSSGAHLQQQEEQTSKKIIYR